MVPYLSSMIRLLRHSYHNWHVRKHALPKPCAAFVHYAEVCLVSILLVLGIRDWLIQSSKVVSGSMIPTLGINDRLIVLKYPHHFSPIRRGDVVLFQSPHGDGKEFVKRVVGLGGETVRIHNGTVYINQAPLHFPGVRVRDDFSNRPDIKIPDDHFFMLGDNRRYSQDSRYWGTVPRNSIIGSAWFIYWPPRSAQAVW
jgi:signal peptidase I